MPLQINSVLLHHDVELFEAFAGAGSKCTFTGIDKKARIVYGALN